MQGSEISGAVDQLRAHGALFAYLHGSQRTGTARPDSDIDIATYFADPVPSSFDLDLPQEIDLMILNGAPLEIAGRIAMEGQLVLEVDSTARVRWESQTRKIYCDEKYRIDRSHREFLAAVRNG